MNDRQVAKNRNELASGGNVGGSGACGMQEGMKFAVIIVLLLAIATYAMRKLHEGRHYRRRRC